MWTLVVLVLARGVDPHLRTLEVAADGVITAGDVLLEHDSQVKAGGPDAADPPGVCASPTDHALAALKQPAAWCAGVGYERVVMADYPTSGSTWLRQLLSYVAAQVHQPSPSCAIFNDEQGKGCPESEGLYCRDDREGLDGACELGGGTAAPPVALVKTHIPTLGAVEPSMCFQRLLVLVREPLALQRANEARKQAKAAAGKPWPETEPANLQCWSSWWESVVKTVPDALVVKYEDLCLATGETLAKVVAHLGMNVSHRDTEAALAVAPKCRYSAADLEAQSKPAPGDESLSESFAAVRDAWGYN